MNRRTVWGILIAVVIALVALPLAFTAFMLVRTGDPFVLLAGVGAALALANVGLVILAVGHVLLREDVTSEQRLIWGLISVFATPGLAVGALVYFLLGKERTAKLFREVDFLAPSTRSADEP